MSHQTHTKWTCDRCGTTVKVKHPGGSTPQLPVEWGHWSRRYKADFEVCPQCDAELMQQFTAPQPEPEQT